MLAALTTRLRRAGGYPARAAPAEPDAPAAETFERATSPAAADAALERPFHVEVAEGGEVLFAQAFEAGSFVIGASPEADIIIPDLADAEVAAIRLETVGAACLVTLTALAPGVSARGRGLAVGRPVLFPERASFTISGAYTFDVAFTPPKRPIVVERSALPSLLLAGGVMLAVLGFATGGMRTPAPEAAARVVPAESAPDELLRPASLPAPAAAQARLAERESALRLAFVSANLVPQLQVAVAADTLVVEGDVTPDERARAVEVISAFSARHGGEVELALASDAREADFFTAVVLEPDTYLIGPDGRRYAPDQRLPNGARILAIEETSVVLEHEGVRQRVYYGR